MIKNDEVKPGDMVVYVGEPFEFGPHAHEGLRHVINNGDVFEVGRAFPDKGAYASIDLIDHRQNRTDYIVLPDRNASLELFKACDR